MTHCPLFRATKCDKRQCAVAGLTCSSKVDKWPHSRVWIDARTIIVAAFTSERPLSLGTFKTCPSRTFAALLQVPSWGSFMTTQSPRLRLFTPSPTLVTSPSPSFPPTNTSPLTPGKDEGFGLERYTPSITLTSAGFIGDRMKRKFTVCGEGGVVRLGMVRARRTSAGWPFWEYTMARFVCIRAEVENRRAEVAMGGNDKIRILDNCCPWQWQLFAHYCISTPRDAPVP